MLKDLLNYGFKIAGVINIDEKGLVNFRIDVPEFKQRVGQVYAWVVGDEVRYIGMAGSGINKRLGEHRNGWRGGSATGVTKSKLLNESLVNGEHIVVYGRTSDVFTQEVELLGKKTTLDFSLTSQEEDALIKEFDPVWNVNNKL